MNSFLNFYVFKVNSSINLKYLYNFYLSSYLLLLYLNGNKDEIKGILGINVQVRKLQYIQ